jgi:PhzF family phenazine biosynthesis protein
MKGFTFKKIDAFTDGSSPGNPAGCVYLKRFEDITAPEMLRIAQQLKGFVNEVAYAFPEGDGYFLKYYSSEREVDFCGHATIALAYDLLSHDPTLKAHSQLALRVGTNRLLVNNDITTDGCVYLMAPPPQHLTLPMEPDDIAWAMGLSRADMEGDYGPALVNGGLKTLIVPIRRAGVLCDIQPDFELLHTFCVKHDVDILLVFTPNATRAGSNYRTRVFAPRFGYLEDPATGSGNAAFGYYLLQQNKWSGGRLVIEQGTSFECPNIVRLRSMQQDGQTRIWIGGAAAVKIEGTYYL